ncbi:hypothetical protein HRbin12_00079 [bacterium HR12]|nr:hypothetical protein HRbin12_00079 [bacterium HR12]
MKTRWTTLLRASLPTALLAVALAAGSSAAAQAGTISGKVVNGTTGEPAAGVDVRARLFTAQTEPDPLEVTADERGRFAFESIPAGVVGYQLEVAYRGAVYRSVATGFDPASPAEQTLRIYEPTTDPSRVTLESYVVWVDREGGGVAVQHDLSWSNAGDEAYVGEDGVVVRIPLPEGATNLQFLGTFLENPGRTRDGAYVSDAPIVPGASSATLRYNAPPLDRLTLEVPFATTSLQLFVPQDVRVRAPALRLAGTVTDQGITYQVYEARDLAPGTALEVAMSQAAAPRGARTALWILLGALGVVLLVGVALIVLRRDRARTPAPRSAGRPPRAKARASAPASAADGDGRAVELEDPDLIVEEIAALDLSFERGLIEERTYRRLRVAAKERLLRAEEARAAGKRR